MCKKSFKKRREILNNIPKGMYCYKIINYDESTCILHTKPCPYWKSIGKQKAKCKLYNIKDKMRQDCFTLLWDQCKACGLKENWNEKEPENI